MGLAGMCALMSALQLVSCMRLMSKLNYTLQRNTDDGHMPDLGGDHLDASHSCTPQGWYSITRA
jgi:hypothetical protein